VSAYVDLVIQHAMRLRHFFMSDLPCSAIFFHVSHKEDTFSEKVIEQKMYVKYVIFWSDFNKT